MGLRFQLLSRFIYGESATIISCQLKICYPSAPPCSPPKPRISHHLMGLLPHMSAPLLSNRHLYRTLPLTYPKTTCAGRHHRRQAGEHKTRKAPTSPIEQGPNGDINASQGKMGMSGSSLTDCPSWLRSKHTCRSSRGGHTEELMLRSEAVVAGIRVERT